MLIKELQLKYRMLEIDETTNIIEMLKEDDEEKLMQGVQIITYYLDDNTNDWTEMPLFSIVAWDGTYDIVNHYLGSQVYDDIYRMLVKRNLLERIN